MAEPRVQSLLDDDSELLTCGVCRRHGAVQTCSGLWQLGAEPCFIASIMSSDDSVKTLKSFVAVWFPCLITFANTQ